MKMLGIHCIEDCLELLAGLKGPDLIFKIEQVDATIMYSIARQVFKGSALTDRQYNLMKEKLQKYKMQFEQQNIYGFDNAIKVLRHPLREIDRSKYIKILTKEQKANLRIVDAEYCDWFVIRFPFKKQHICLIQEFNTDRTEYDHKKGSHQHIFKFTERNVLNIVDRFIDKNFEIDKEILDFYNSIKEIKTKEAEYLNTLDKDAITFANNNAKEFAENEIGEFNKDNYLKYLDRRWRYGIDSVPPNLVTNNNLINTICYRNSTNIHISSKLWSIVNLFEAIYELDRFPLLVILDTKNSLNDLHNIYDSTKGFIMPNEQSVLFRYDNPSEFNDYVKEKKLNNWVDKTTKIVYINNEKLPKLLLKEDFNPVAVLQFSEHRNRQILSYINHNCDLIMCYAEEIDMMRRYSKFYDGQL